MKKIIQSSIIVCFLLTIFSFTEVVNNEFVGIYGVSENDPSKIELTLNPDNTFTYQDFSNLEKPVDVEGTWEVRRSQIILKNSNSEISFHSKWKIVDGGMTVKSRKGLNFYTLEKK